MKRLSATQIQAGPEGRRLVTMLTDAATLAIKEFPASTSEQRVAIAMLVASGLDAWADLEAEREEE